MELSPETIGKLNDIANGVLVVGLILSLGATVAIGWTGKLKDRALQQQLEATRAEATRAQAELESRVGPRKMPQEQMLSLIAALKEIAPRVPEIVIEHVDDAESTAYASNFTLALNTAGIRQRIVMVRDWKPPFYEMGLRDTPDQLVVTAFRKAGVPVRYTNTVQPGQPPAIVVNPKVPR